MTNLTFIRYEVLRSIRNRRSVIFTLAFPIVLYLTITEANRHATFDGINFSLYFMAGMITLGTMAAVLASGAAISADRAVGWTRQLRITPLKSRSYFGAKILCGYIRALFTILVMCIAGTALGVRLSVGEWATLIGLVLLGLIPFVVLGILLGHVLTPDSLGPAIGGIVTFFSLLGGAYAFELAKSGPLFQLMKVLPSYWLVQAGKAAFGGGNWPAEGWFVIAGWSLVLIPLSVIVYQRDTGRV